MKEPDAYLGADISMKELSNGDKAWSLSSDTYVKRAVACVSSGRQAAEEEGDFSDGVWVQAGTGWFTGVG